MEVYINDSHVVTEQPREENFVMHTHNYFEIFCFLSGDADYSVEGYRYRMQRGDLLLSRKNEAHHIMVKSDARYERMYVHFDIPDIALLDPEYRLLVPFLDRPLGKFNQYKASLFPDQRWIYYLDKLCDSADDHCKLYYLLVLLNELAECFETVKTSGPPSETDRAMAVMRYINKHLGEELSLGFLADHFNLSKTHLNEIFKQSAGTTVWKYIVVKRLVAARERILVGEAPTKVYSECGFQDYTTFFRAYKQHFGVSPKCDMLESVSETGRCFRI